MGQDGRGSLRTFMYKTERLFVSRNSSRRLLVHSLSHPVENPQRRPPPLGSQLSFKEHSSDNPATMRSLILAALAVPCVLAKTKAKVNHSVNPVKVLARSPVGAVAARQDASGEFCGTDGSSPPARPCFLPVNPDSCRPHLSPTPVHS